MSWSERAQLYRDSEAHREGEDLDLVVEWSEGAETALDVATGGGHVARRLREAGVNVVTVDSAPGMQPDVVSRSEDIPFADESFDVVVCRVAAHHFDDVPKAVSEMARVSRDRVIVVDNLFLDDDAEEADRVRDPSHVKNWSEGEWRGFFASAGLQVDEARRLEKPIEVEPWLERAGTSEEDAQRVRELLGDRIQDGWITLDRLVIRGPQVMAIIVDNDTKLVVQGLTGREGSFHGVRNRDYGTNVVAGVTPGKGGADVEGIPVFDTVAEAVTGGRREHGDGLRPGALRDRCRLRGGGRGHRDRDLHRGGASGPRDAACLQLHPPEGHHDARPELPRRALPRGRRTSGSSRRRSSARAGSASSAARGRSRTRSATS